MIRGVVFDLGETLFRFTGDWPAIFDRSRQRLVQFLMERGFEIPGGEFDWVLKQRIVAAQDVRENDFIERPTGEIFREVMAEFGFENLPVELVQESMELLYQESEAHWQPVPGVDGFLHGLQQAGYQLGLISNASDTANVDRLIDKAGIRGFLDPILISSEVGVRKPAPLIFQQLLQQWNFPAEQTVMVGDTLAADILGAQRLGMHQIWLRSAVDRPDNLAWFKRLKPERQVDRLEEIPNLLADWNGVDE